MIKNNESRQRVRTIRQQDLDFTWSDGLVVFNRAGIEISDRCPTEYKIFIAQAIDRGWLNPVAWMPEQQLTWEKLQK